jgi:acyl-CoA synthetase (AMP-forming)/AMP-acid ligase II
MDRLWTQHYEPGVPADLQFTPRTLVDMFEATCRDFADRPAVTLKGKTLTYGQLKAQVDRFAAGLAGLGVRTNSRVAVWMPNLPQFVIAYFATLKLGAQVVGTNPLYVGAARHRSTTPARVVVTLDFLWWGSSAASKRTPVEHVIVTSIPDFPFHHLLAPPAPKDRAVRGCRASRGCTSSRSCSPPKPRPSRRRHSPGTIPRSCCIPAAPPASPRARC